MHESLRVIRFCSNFHTFMQHILSRKDGRGKGHTSQGGWGGCASADEWPWMNPAEEEPALNYRPPPLHHPAPRYRRYIQQRKRKRRNIQEGFSFQNPGAVERTESSFLYLKVVTFWLHCERTNPALYTPFFPLLAHLFFPAVCSWQKAPALSGKKGPTVTGGGERCHPNLHSRR